MAFLGVASFDSVLIVSHVIVLFDFHRGDARKGERFACASRCGDGTYPTCDIPTLGYHTGLLFPLALAGGPRWNRLGYAQIGGLAVATLLRYFSFSVFDPFFRARSEMDNLGGDQYQDTKSHRFLSEVVRRRLTRDTRPWLADLKHRGSQWAQEENLFDTPPLALNYWWVVPVALGALPGAALSFNAKHSEFPMGRNKKESLQLRHHDRDVTPYYKDWCKGRACGIAKAARAAVRRAPTPSGAPSLPACDLGMSISKSPSMFGETPKLP